MCSSFHAVDFLPESLVQCCLGSHYRGVRTKVLLMQPPTPGKATTIAVMPSREDTPRPPESSAREGATPSPQGRLQDQTRFELSERQAVVNRSDSPPVTLKSPEPESIEGTIVTLDISELGSSSNSGERKALQIARLTLKAAGQAADIKLMCDQWKALITSNGKVCSLTDLKVGQRVKVTYEYHVGIRTDNFQPVVLRDWGHVITLDIASDRN
jgi:hypothetical protein